MDDVNDRSGNDVVGADKINIVGGANFSGRSSYLRRVAGIDALPDANVSKVYLAPEAETALSGLTLSVEQELLLHRRSRDFAAKLDDLWKLFGLQSLLQRAPSTLSGGEMAKLVIASAILLKPGLLAIDGTLEQVDADVRKAFIEKLFRGRLADTQVFIADNRLAETGIKETCLPPPSSQRPPADPIRAVSVPAPEIQPCRLDLDNIHFCYPGSAANVLNGISASFEPGHIYFLHGANGAGKSTLAKLSAATLRSPFS
jgi:ABC-type Mn2+/Zn2+ transport system ATPase subunit